MRNTPFAARNSLGIAIWTGFDRDLCLASGGQQVRKRRGQQSRLGNRRDLPVFTAELENESSVIGAVTDNPD
jgi:hypothetical protein